MNPYLAKGSVLRKVHHGRKSIDEWESNMREAGEKICRVDKDASIRRFRAIYSVVISTIRR